MKYTEAKEYLYSDGSFRDLYILDSNLEDLERFLDFVRPILREDSFALDGEIARIPEKYEDGLKMGKESACVLSIPVGSSTLCCHFFDSLELELDLVPSDYANEEDWAALDGFLSELATALGKEVVLTAENSPSEVYIRYKPTTEQNAAGCAH